MADALTIRDLTADEREWANAQYRAIQFATTPLDAIALLAELTDARLGLGRLVALAEGVTELGGIWTDEAVRGRGVARAMVRALLARFEQIPAGRQMSGAGRPANSLPCGAAAPGPYGLWCIPFAHLAAFYRSFGFADRAAPWPPTIAAKVADCIAHGLPPVVVLVR